tara:strand:- start:406 stop:636 length:231 start_codon:yes stop_codon:yes gene_type:complete
MLLNTCYYYYLGRSAPVRVKSITERVSVDLGLTRQVREQRGTIIPNQFTNPTRNPTRFSPTRRKVLNPNSSRGSND